MEPSKIFLGGYQGKAMGLAGREMRKAWSIVAEFQNAVSKEFICYHCKTETYQCLKVVMVNRI